MKKLDLKKELKPYYTATAKKVAFLDVPPMNYLMIDGKGDPNGEDFQSAVQALYNVAYTMKFMLKMGKEHVDYPVMALEGLWWMDGGRAFSMENRNAWRWTAMIVCPDVITTNLVEAAKELVRQKCEKKKIPVPVALDRVRFGPFDEGRVAQVMHIGPYADEPATLDRLHAAIDEAGLTMRGKHHEIYMGDPRRTKPEKLKTILRWPVSKN